MKYGLLLFLFLSGCATTGSNQKITMPQVDKKESNAGLIKEATKTKYRIGEKGNQIFDFYYGPKGSYFVVVTGAEGSSVMNLTEYDVALTVNGDSAQNPEVLSMALEDQQVLSGFGETREGPTQFELSLTPVDQSLTRPIKFNFKININLFL